VPPDNAIRILVGQGLARCARMGLSCYPTLSRRQTASSPQLPKILSLLPRKSQNQQSQIFVLVQRSTERNETRAVQCCWMVGARKVCSSALRIALRTSAQWQLHPGSATMRPPGTHAFPNRPRARTSAGTQPPGKGARRSQYQTARGRQHHGRPIGARDVGGVGRGDDRLGRVGRDGPSGSASCAAG